MSEEVYKNEAWLREKYVEQGLLTRKVAKLADTTHTTIRRWLKKNNIEARTRETAVEMAVGTIHPSIYIGGTNKPYWIVQSS